MSKAKVKVKVSPGKGKSGTLVTKVPVTVARNDKPSGKRMFDTKARMMITVKTTNGGKPRARSR